MSGLVQYLEEAIVSYVKQRMPTEEWKQIHSRNDIEGTMEDDDTNELRNYCFEELMNEVNWNVIIQHIKQLVKNQEVESESESESESEEEDPE